MLRSGYSIDAVQKEVLLRRFIDPIDSPAEKSLLQAGATPAFIEVLRTGAFAIPPEQIAAVRDKLSAQAKRRELQAGEAQKLNLLYDHQQTQARTPPSTRSGSVENAIATLVKGDLVTSKNGILSTFNDQPLEKKKLIGLYYSAHWCGPCRKFTPKLVEFYNRVAGTHPEFEIVFVSYDRSGPAMEDYMRDMQMPWPAVKYDKISDKLSLRKYAGTGIPCLVLVDAGGQVISDSYAGKSYLGPEKVLTDIETILAGGATDQAPQRHVAEQQRSYPGRGEVIPDTISPVPEP